MFENSTIGQLPAPYSPFGVLQIMNYPLISPRLLGSGALNMNRTTLPSFPRVTGINFAQSNSPNLSRFLRAVLDSMKFALLARSQRQIHLGVPLLNVRNSTPNFNFGIKIESYCDINRRERTLGQFPQQSPQFDKIYMNSASDTTPKIEQLSQTIPDDSITSVNTPQTELQEDISIAYVKKVQCSKKIKKPVNCCHYDKPHYARGFCLYCYLKHGRTKKPWLCSHEKLYACGLCQKCYKKASRKKLLTDKIKNLIKQRHPVDLTQLNVDCTAKHKQSNDSDGTQN